MAVSWVFSLFEQLWDVFLFLFFFGGWGWWESDDMDKSVTIM